MEDEGSARPDRSPKRPAEPNWALALDLGFRLGISVALGVGGGLLVDNWLGTTPIATLVGTLLGIAAAMVTIWKVAQGAMRR